MMKPPRQWSDQRIEEIIGNLLRIGVVLSASIVICGATVFLAHHYSDHVDYRTFHSEPPEYTSITGIFRTAFGLHGRGLIQLGLLLLIATPVARVAFSIWGFAAERDRMYVVFTVIVLAVLLYSLLGSGSGI